MLAIAAGAGVALIVVWQLGKAGRAVGQAIADGAVNPGSANNLAYRGVNSIGSAVTGDQSWNLGGAIYDWFHDVPADQPGAAAVDLNPADDRNLAYRGVNSAGQAITGDQSWSLGAAIWELFNPRAVQEERQAIGQTQGRSGQARDSERSFSDGANTDPTFGYEPASWAFVLPGNPYAGS